MENKLPTRKRNRLKDYDYSSSGMYFVTICTKDKKNILWAKESSDVVVKSVKLSQYGQIVDETINSIPTYYPHVTLLQYVIMPNHVHLVLYIPNDGGRILSSPTMSRASIITVIGQMKRQVSKMIGKSIWQRSFHDHVIRDKRDYNKISEYIRENPIKWKTDCFYSEI
ncbi:MAG: transposase [Clostridia bacterium]|nr:transposase [Clostridia bacterium]MBR5632805.1 transposase [Clostridia bacterium]